MIGVKTTFLEPFRLFSYFNPKLFFLPQLFHPKNERQHKKCQSLAAVSETKGAVSDPLCLTEEQSLTSSGS